MKNKFIKTISCALLMCILSISCFAVDVTFPSQPQTYDPTNIIKNEQYPNATYDVYSSPYLSQAIVIDTVKQNTPIKMLNYVHAGLYEGDYFLIEYVADGIYHRGYINIDKIQLQGYVPGYRPVKDPLTVKATAKISASTPVYSGPSTSVFKATSFSLSADTAVEVIYSAKSVPDPTVEFLYIKYSAQGGSGYGFVPASLLKDIVIK